MMVEDDKNALQMLKLMDTLGLMYPVKFVQVHDKMSDFHHRRLNALEKQAPDLVSELRKLIDGQARKQDKADSAHTN